MPFFAFGRSRKNPAQLPAASARRPKPRASVQLRLEVLEERCTPATLRVGATEAFTTIQSAVNAAAANDTILVDAGTYQENVTINKALTLEGADHGINADT